MMAADDASEPSRSVAEVLTLLVPSAAFLDDDIESLLAAHADASGDAWLAVLLVPAASWSTDDLLGAARNVRKRAHAAALVLREQLDGFVLPIIAPADALGTLRAMMRRAPAGGTVVLAWPGSTETGLTVLRKARQTCLATESGRAAPASRSQL